MRDIDHVQSSTACEISYKLLMGHGYTFSTTVMRFATIFTLGIAAVFTSASLLARLTDPPCYVACVAKADIGDCSATDTKCLCTNPIFLSETETCVEATCEGADLVEAMDLGQSSCLEAGVTLSATPTSGSAPPTISGLKIGAAVHDATNLNSFIGLAAVGLVALAIN